MSLRAYTMVLRADATPDMGTGHIMRAIALGQAWKDYGGRVAFISSCCSKALLHRMEKEGFAVHLLTASYPESSDWDCTNRLLAEYRDAWVVVDGYHFDEVYHKRIKEAGHMLLVIDDLAHIEHYWADVVLNQNINAQQLRYSGEPYTRYLLGTRYVLLRREFLAYGRCEREIPQMARRLLITFGGSDPANLTLKVIEALQEAGLSGLEVRAVVGAANPHVEKLEMAARKGPVVIRLLFDAENMPELMCWADVAVSGAGSTCWELMFMALPSLLLTSADNQVEVAQSLGNAGLAINLGWHDGLSSSKIAREIRTLLQARQVRSEMAARCRACVDGRGRHRVMRRLKGIVKD